MVRLESKERLNYLKFSIIVVDEFPKGLRQTFKVMWNKKFRRNQWDDSDAVRKFGNKGIPTQKSYEEWDSTALFQATLYAKSFRSPDGTGNLKTLDEMYVKPRGVPHGQFHGSVISANGDPYETFALSIDQLRRLRNSLCHCTSTELDQNTFDQYVNLAKDAFEALSVETDSIDEILHAELHTLRERVLTCAFFFDPFIEFCCSSSKHAGKKQVALICINTSHDAS